MAHAEKWAKYCSAKCRRQRERFPDKTLAEVTAMREARVCICCGVSITHLPGCAKYCGGECRNWYKNHPGEVFADRHKPKHSNCEVCGEPIVGRRTFAKTCGRDCLSFRHRHPGKTRPPRSSTCLHCGIEIVGKKRGTKYCSRECGGRYWHAEDRRQNPENLAKWRAKNEERIREYSARRRALEFDNPGYVAVSVKDWLAILRIHDWRCAYCLQRSDRTLEREHVIPLTAGGRHAPGNLVPACRSCNSRKRDKLLAAWRLEMRKAGGDYEVAAFRRRPAKIDEAA